MTRETDDPFESFVRRRDERSFRRLYREHTPALFALAMRLTRGEGADSEELVQEVWVRAVERLERFDRRSAFRTWLSGILINCYRELVRRRVRRPRSLEEAGIQAAAERRAQAERAQTERPRPVAEPADVERAIAKLADGYREVLVLHDLNGFTHQEIGELLGIATGTAKSQLSRARARLRQLLIGGDADSKREETR